VGDILSEALRTDLRCSPAAAEYIAARARSHMARVLGSAEDNDEDLTVRLQDPRVFGVFAESLLPDQGLAEDVRVAVVERAFDLLPLPATEGEVILVQERSPPGLLSLAAFLAERGGFTVLHAMHLVYAIFLDRSLLDKVTRTTRAAVLGRVLRLAEATDRLRLLYAALHLGSVPEPEAHDELRHVLRSRALRDSFKHALAAIISSADGGVGALMRLAQEEGLLPVELSDSEAPGVLANIPRMPPRLSPVGRRWLDRHGGRRRKRESG